jgi:hypothetical protein
MRRVVAILVAAAAMATGLTVETASADVHGVSQAGCGASENSGATVSEQAIANGRPPAPIPVSASDGRTQGKGGDGDPACDVPPGPPQPSN